MQLFGKPLELVILDVDGTVLDLLQTFQRNYEAAAVRCGLPVEPIRQYLAAVADGRRNHFASAYDSARGLWQGITDETAHALVLAFREEERYRPYPPVPGSIEAIQWFRERSIPLGLCTTNERSALESRLHLAGIELDWFCAMSTWESPHRKPDPRAFDPIFEAVYVPREHAVYVGDWYPDLQAARGADVPFIAVLSGGIPRHTFLREGVPDDHIIERLADLPKLITE